MSFHLLGNSRIAYTWRAFGRTGVHFHGGTRAVARVSRSTHRQFLFTSDPQSFFSALILPHADVRFPA